MFEGIYCKEKNSNTVYESILVDNFNDCIDSALNPQSCAENPDSGPVAQFCAQNLSDSEPVEMNGASNHNPDTGTCSSDVLEPITTCVAGQNVRATYSVDRKLYEARIMKLFGKAPTIMARVRYHGYGNEEAVPVSLIYPSLGQNAIKEQIKRAAMENGEKIHSDESDKKKIKWNKGMPCRALFDGKDIIYEATVLDVNDSKRTAFVEMLGYGTRFYVNFENMYESIPKLREQQAASAQKHIVENNRKLACNGSHPKDTEKEVDVTSDVSQNSKTENIDEETQNSESQTSDEVHLMENESNGAETETEVDGISEISKEPKSTSTNEKEHNGESAGVHLQESKSNCPDQETDVDLTSAISKVLKLNCINDEERNSEIVASDGAVLKENPSNCLDLDPNVSVSADTSNVSNMSEKVQSSKTQISDSARVKSTSSSTGFSSEPKLNNNTSEMTDVLQETNLPLSLRSEEILQPESESEALACLLSANYLSGYYAGYYDCIRRRQTSD